MNLKLQTTDFELQGNAQPLATRDRYVYANRACDNLKSEIKKQKSPRFGMTLIELLIVITILTTLVAGVIPLLSPNNDERKIKTAARSFQTYINLAKAKAARSGRPHGIAIVESSPGSGVALEVFGLEVPPPFAGFSSASGVRIDKNWATDVLSVQFLLADGLITSGTPLLPDEYTPDDLPPNFLSLGDYIVIDEVRYRFIDTNHNADYTYPVSSRLEVERVESTELTYAYLSNKNYTSTLGESHSLTALKRYQIQRQPATSAVSPFQFPAGVGIDMQASVTTGDASLLPAGYARFPSSISLSTDRSGIPSGNPVPTDRIGIMFSPSGSVSSISLNGTELENTVQIAMLIGRVENTGIDPTLTVMPWVVNDPNDKEEVKEKQDTINWLNLDSRIMSLAVGSGRSVVNETAFVNLGLVKANGGDVDGDDLLIKADADDQINAAYEFAREMSTVQ